MNTGDQVIDADGRLFTVLNVPSVTPGAEMTGLYRENGTGRQVYGTAMRAPVLLVVWSDVADPREGAR